MILKRAARDGSRGADAHRSIRGRLRARRVNRKGMMDMKTKAIVAAVIVLAVLIAFVFWNNAILSWG